MASRYPDIKDSELAGLLQFANAAADLPQADVSAVEVHAPEPSSARKRKRNEEDVIDDRLRSQATGVLDSRSEDSTPTLQSAAAVIFRKVTENSKKYSRPPLGKVFTDMELPPEIFLKLQNAAKGYMLDGAHPERKGVVGQKRHDQTVDAKLKLWTCVDQFMDMDNNGEKFFGHGVGTDIRDAPIRTHFWPQDRDKIIKVCMPLFRKLVTNERQRLYAINSRKDKQHQKKGRGMHNDDGSNEGQDPAFASDSPVADVDQNGTIGLNVNKASTSNGYRDEALLKSPQQFSNGPVAVHVNIVSKDDSGTSRRVVPPMTLTSDVISTTTSLYLAIGQIFDLSEHEHEDEDGKTHPPTLRVWMEGGLFELRSDEDLNVALDRVKQTEWMDGQLYIILEV